MNDNLCKFLAESYSRRSGGKAQTIRRISAIFPSFFSPITARFPVYPALLELAKPNALFLGVVPFLKPQSLRNMEEIRGIGKK